MERPRKLHTPGEYVSPRMADMLRELRRRKPNSSVLRYFKGNVLREERT